MTNLVSFKSAAQASKDLISSDLDCLTPTLMGSDFAKLWEVLRVFGSCEKEDMRRVS